MSKVAFRDFPVPRYWDMPLGSVLSIPAERDGEGRVIRWKHDAAYRALRMDGHDLPAIVAAHLINGASVRLCFADGLSLVIGE